MKPRPVLAVCVGVLGLMGCSESEKTGAISAAPTNVSARELRKEAGQVVDTARQSAIEHREQFLASMEAKLKECGNNIAAFDAKLATLTQEYSAKAEGTKALEALREKRTQLGQQLEKLRQCSQEAWQETKAAVESTAAEVDKAYEIAKSRF